LWSRCLAEKYVRTFSFSETLHERSANIAKYKPVYLLIDLLMFCLELKTLAVAPFIIDTLLPVAQQTGDLIAIPRFKRESYAELVNYIDVSECLTIIHLAALGCMNDREHTKRFWRLMRLDFVLMILSQHQPVADFDMMLQLLAMSTLKDSLGPLAIDLDPDLQLKQAEYIIERVSHLLINLPTVPEGSPKHDRSAILDLRLQILRTLTAFCQTAWGGEAVAMHPNAIGRLVKLMSDELDALYDHRSTHAQSANIITLTTRLLHHLTTHPTHQMHTTPISQKLSRIHGGTQKYLICLARLNFAEEDLVLESGLGVDVSECAHEMLEAAVTPEEGEGIWAAFAAA
jgi:hypothetical protein